MRKIVKNFFQNRVVWFLFSLVIALVAWLYVSSEINPVRNNQISFTIQYENESVMENYDLRLSADAPSTIALRVTGMAADLATLQQNNVVIADLSSVTEPGEQEVPIRLAAYTNATQPTSLTYYALSGGSSNTLTVNVIRVVEGRRFSIGSGGISYDVSEGNGEDVTYTAIGSALSQEEVLIDGPEEIVSNIGSVEAVCLFPDPLTETTTLTARYRIYDLEGEELAEEELEDVTFSPESVTVTVQVKMIKEVPLTYELVHTAGTNADNVTCELSQETVRLSGEAYVLEEIEEIDVGRIRLDNFELVNTVRREIVAPAMTEIYQDSEEVVFSLTITDLEVREYTVEKFSYQGADEDVTVEVRTESITIRLRGEADILDQISEEDITVIANVEEINGTGGHEVAFTIQVSGYSAEEVGLIDQGHTILVNLTRRAAS